jgi:putative endonuclease
MFYVYILKSKKDNKSYIGSTNDLRSRMKLHNDGKVPSTKLRRPLTLIYYEAYLAEGDARRREQKLKNFGQGITNIYKRLSDSFGKKVQDK